MTESPDQMVDFCFCLSLRKTSFYLMINVLDLVSAATFGFIVKLLGPSAQFPWSENFSTFLSVVGISLWGLACAAFVVYLIKLSYSTAAQKLYSITRIIVNVIRIAMYALACFGVLLLTRRDPNGLTADILARSIGVIVFGILLFFEAINLSWSFELKKLAFENPEFGIDFIPTKKDLNLRVPLASDLSGSEKTKPEAINDANKPTDVKEVKVEPQDVTSNSEPDTQKQETKGEDNA